MKRLRQVGSDFVSGFLAGYSGAIPLRSKDPGLCWKASGQVAFAIVSEFSGPNTVEEDAPLLFGLRTNSFPPPAIYYHLKSPKVCHKLGIQSTPLILDTPALELIATPDEMAQLGHWLTAWLDSYFYQRTTAPDPPTTLLSVIVNEEYKEVATDITTIGPDWRFKMALWTPAALTSWNTFLHK